MGNKCICLFTEKISDSWPLQYDERHHDETIDQLRKRSEPKCVGTDAGIFAYEYCEVNYETISKYYSTILKTDHLFFV